MASVRPFTLVGVMLLLYLASGSAAGQTDVLHLRSQPGDFVGGGVEQVLTPADGTFMASRNFDNGVTINFDGGGARFWSLSFAAPQDAELVPGTYENATRWPFQLPTAPGMSISGEGRGCNTLTGRFEVLEAVYGPLGEVERFAATFEQHCEGQAPALLGSVLFNSTLPPPPPPPTVCMSRVATIPALLGEVGMLGTSASTLNALRYFLLAAQWSLDNQYPRLARSYLAEFSKWAVQASNMRAGDPNAIAATAANSLVCGASNVLTNIALP